MEIFVTYSSSFKRDYKVWIKRNPSKEELLVKVIDLFIIDPFNPALRTHKLKGKLKDCHAFTVEYDLRIIFYLLFVINSEKFVAVKCSEVIHK